MKYKMAAEGKRLDSGTGYDMTSQDGIDNDEGMSYSMGGRESSKDGGMSYSMGGRDNSKGGMPYEESNIDGKVSEDGYTQSGYKK